MLKNSRSLCSERYWEALHFFSLSLISCSGDTKSINCDCGIIEDLDSELDFEPMEWTYYADIRNVCTNEIENDIQITENIFVNYHPGG